MLGLPIFMKWRRTATILEVKVKSIGNFIPTS